MRELWGNIDPSLAKGRHGALLMQCLWFVPQDEWPEQAPHKTKTKIGKIE